MASFLWCAQTLVSLALLLTYNAFAMVIGALLWIAATGEAALVFYISSINRRKRHDPQDHAGPHHR
jgi:hypothetical protein